MNLLETNKKERKKTTVMSLKRNQLLCKNREPFFKANSKRTREKMRESYTGKEMREGEAFKENKRLIDHHLSVCSYIRRFRFNYSFEIKKRLIRIRGHSLRPLRFHHV
jgi:hypothetical protein